MRWLAASWTHIGWGLFSNSRRYRRSLAPRAAAVRVRSIDLLLQGGVEPGVLERQDAMLRPGGWARHVRRRRTAARIVVAQADDPDDLAARR